MKNPRDAVLLAIAGVLVIAGIIAPASWALVGATGCVVVVLSDYAYRRQQGR